MYLAESLEISVWNMTLNVACRTSTNFLLGHSLCELRQKARLSHSNYPFYSASLGRNGDWLVRTTQNSNNPLVAHALRRLSISSLQKTLQWVLTLSTSFPMSWNREWSYRQALRIDRQNSLDRSFVGKFMTPLPYTVARAVKHLSPLFAERMARMKDADSDAGEVVELNQYHCVSLVLMLDTGWSHLMAALWSMQWPPISTNVARIDSTSAFRTLFRHIHDCEYDTTLRGGS